MGEVYLGEHRELGREVAIKLLKPRIAEDDAAMERLRREARAAARIGNPHIIDVYDLGISDDGQPYVVMKLLEGRDLLTIMQEDAPLQPRRVVHLCKQIGSALRAAHGAGIVHRDLKPENIIVEVGLSGESAIVLDFGIAHTLADTETRLTREGEVMGTPGYMAPEQAMGEPVDGRADQYSLAVICYELLAGTSPYERQGALQVIAAQITQPPRPLSQFVDQAVVSPALQAVVMRGMSRYPADRYADAWSFIEALEGALTAESAETRVVVAEPAGTPPAIRGGLLALGLLGLAAAGYFGIQAFGGKDQGADAGVAGSAVPATSQKQPDGALVAARSDAAVPKAAVDATAPEATAPDARVPDASGPDAAVPDTAPAVVARSAPKGRRAARRRRVVASPKPDPVATPEPPQPEPPKPVVAPELTPAEVKPKPETPKPEVVATTPAKPPPKVEPPPPAAPPELFIGSPRIRGDASGRTVSKAINRAKSALKLCASTGAVGVTAKVKFIADEEGFFDEFSVASGDQALGQCAIKALRRVQRLDQRPDTGIVEIEVPLTIKAP